MPIRGKGPFRGPYPELSGQSYDLRNLPMNRWSALNSAGSASSGASSGASSAGASSGAVVGSSSNGTGPSSVLMPNSPTRRCPSRGKAPRRGPYPEPSPSSVSRLQVLSPSEPRPRAQLTARLSSRSPLCPQPQSGDLNRIRLLESISGLYGNGAEIIFEAKETGRYDLYEAVWNFVPAAYVLTLDLADTDNPTC